MLSRSLELSRMQSTSGFKAVAVERQLKRNEAIQAKRGDSGEVRDSGEARRRRSEGSEGSEDEEGEANESGREETSAHRSWRGMQVTIWVRGSLSSRTRSLSSTASLRACTRNSTGESSTSSSRYAQARIVGFVWSAQMIGSVLRSCTGAWDGDHLGTCR